VKSFAPIPLVQFGGHQPYANAGGQMPGPALLAMLRGSTFSGGNPIDAQRGLASAANQPATLLSQLMRSGGPYNVTPGGQMAPGAWMITPDQRDRNTQHSAADWRRRGHPVVQPNSDRHNI
jgi:hypothetical protein